MMLLDTHVYYWFICGDNHLPNSIKDQIEEEEHVFISAATFWEMAIKASIGKIKLPASVSTLMKDCEACQFKILPVLGSHLDHLETLPWIHRDPFDRLLICQAQAENLTLVTKDENIWKYSVKTLWRK